MNKQQLALHCSTAKIGSLPHFQSCLVRCHATYNLARKGLDFSDGSELRVWLWYCNVTRNPQGAYLSSPKHFLVKNGQNRFGKQCFLKFQVIIAHEMTGFPWKCFTVSFSWWEQDSNLLDSNVVLEKPYPRIFEEAGVKHTYLDERS